MPNPNTISTLRYQDIQTSDINIQQQFQFYFTNGQYVQALNLLNNNLSTLQNKAFVANAINTIVNGMLILENYYYQGVVVYLSNLSSQYQLLINNFKNRSNWVSSVQYSQYNFVNYNNELYMCTQTPPIGTIPTNTNYWLYLGLQGIEGAPGVDVIMEYSWESNTSYQLNDLVTYNNNIYVALKNNIGIIPGTDNSVWLLFIQFKKGEIYVGVNPPSIFDNNTIWFKTSIDPSQSTANTPIIGQFQRYLSNYTVWDTMYPNTLFNQVENYSDYTYSVFIDNVTIAPSSWVSNTWTYVYNDLTEQSILDILPIGTMTSAQSNIYNNLSISISNNNIILTSGVSPTVTLNIRIRIIQ